MDTQLIKKRIEQIAISMANTPNSMPTGLLQEDGGKLLFYAYYNQYKQDSFANDEFQRQLELYLEKISSGIYFPSYCNGLSGMLFMLDFLLKDEIINIDISQAKKYCDSFLLKVLEEQMKNGECDFLHTATGILYYFANNSSTYIDIIDHSVEYLKQNAIKMECGIAWRDKFEKNSLINFSISISHGMAGLVIVLTALEYNRKTTHKLYPLIQGAIDFILSQKYTNDIGSCYPTYCLEADQGNKSRLGWCNGDLGIGLALWYAGKIYRNKLWTQEALKIFNIDMYRKNVKETLVKDAGFCHGTSGIAQIYRRMYFETGNPLYYETSMHWINETLKMGNEDDEKQIGYKTYFQGKYYPCDNSLLSGLSGIGMVLLSFLCDEKKSSWDKLFLLSIN